MPFKKHSIERMKKTHTNSHGTLISDSSPNESSHVIMNMY